MNRVRASCLVSVDVVGGARRQPIDTASYRARVLADDHVTVILAAIPTILASLAAFIATVRNRHINETVRDEARYAHAETKQVVEAVAEKVVDAADVAASTAAEVKEALNGKPNGA